MNNIKVIFIFLSTILEIFYVYVAYDEGIGNILGGVVVIAQGLHFIYGVIFKTEIHMAGYIVPANERPILRVILLLGGIYTVFFCLNFAIKSGA